MRIRILEFISETRSGVDSAEPKTAIETSGTRAALSGSEEGASAFQSVCAHSTEPQRREQRPLNPIRLLQGSRPADRELDANCLKSGKKATNSDGISGGFSPISQLLPSFHFPLRLCSSRFSSRINHISIPPIRWDSFWIPRPVETNFDIVLKCRCTDRYDRLSIVRIKISCCSRSHEDFPW
jgi:hypothetical protein